MWLIFISSSSATANVFYIEVPFEDRMVRAKYAILSLPQLERLVEPRTLQSYFWARFAQPMRLIWVRDGASRRRLVDALTQAVVTTAGEIPDDRLIAIRDRRSLLDYPDQIEVE